jgi:hypothetical protein
MSEFGLDPPHGLDLLVLRPQTNNLVLKNQVVRLIGLRDSSHFFIDFLGEKSAVFELRV